MFRVIIFNLVSANRSVSEDSSRLLVTAANIFSSLILLGDSELVRSISPIALFLFISVLGTEKLAQEVGTKLMIPIRSIIEQINDGSEGMDLVVETFAASLLDILYPDGFDSKIQEPNSDGEIYLVKNAMLTMIIILTTRPGLGFNANVLAKYASFLENAIDGNSQVVLLINCRLLLLLYNVSEHYHHLRLHLIAPLS